VVLAWTDQAPPFDGAAVSAVPSHVYTHRHTHIHTHTHIQTHTKNTHTGCITHSDQAPVLRWCCSVHSAVTCFALSVTRTCTNSFTTALVASARSSRAEREHEKGNDEGETRKDAGRELCCSVAGYALCGARPVMAFYMCIMINLRKF